MRYPSRFEMMATAQGKSALLKQIERCYTHPLGPGRVPSLRSGGKRSIVGAVVPHAGYEYSGPVAAHVYSALAEDGFPEKFIIIGGDHVGHDEAVITTETFVTPLGKVPVDMETAGEIGLMENKEVHEYEHAIGMQLPFLQHLSSEIKFVPVYVPSHYPEVAKEAGEKIGKAIRGKNVVVIAATDFTHAGPDYGQIPPEGIRVDEFVKRQDMLAIDAILKLSHEELLKAVMEHDISMCGVGSVVAMLVAIRKIASGARLLKHASSHDIVPGPDAVGYGAIVIQ
ncbi:MAG: AmmeMemoRadiSam system protein B [Candidatus Hadarchaeales archaeon]